MQPTSHNPHRRGSVLVVVLGLIVVVTGLVFVASESSVSVSGETRRFNQGVSALHAVNAVLARREQTVISNAEYGEFTRFATMQNFGIDYVGNCEVRWKIEPARTADQYVDSTGTIQLREKYVVNPPSPDANDTGDGAHRQANGITYLYRIAAEGRVYKTNGLTTGELSDVESRAQGAHFVTCTNTPLFRYVIFSVQDGPKGDLEMAHADTVNISGGIYSNGSVYLGGGLTVNDKLAQRGSLSSSGGVYTATQTKIGTTADRAGVLGYDGIFRLSKSSMFSIVNGLPLANTTVAVAGTPIGDWTASGSYDTTSSIFNLESAIPSGSTAYTMTSQGSVINPYRIKNLSGAVTTGPGSDTARLINGTPITGASVSPGISGNDSRDIDRPTTSAWATKAVSDFQNYTRTRFNGAAKERLLDDLKDRPLEAQRLAYVDVDNDGTTDDHEYARPLFYDPGTGSTTVQLPNGNNPLTTPVIEYPGYELSKALGSNYFMVRRDDTGSATCGTGWDVRNKNSPAVAPTSMTTGGVTIRERPVPDTSYWPGTYTVPIVGVNSPHYMPYAYGKQWYPTIWPARVSNVSDNLLWSYNQATAVQNIATSTNALSYSQGGRMVIEAASYAGPSNAAYNGTTQFYSRSGAWSSWSGDTYEGVANRQYYYRDPWRFVHLGQNTVGAGSALDLVYYLNDSPAYDERSTTIPQLLHGLPFSTVNPTAPTTATISADGQLPNLPLLDPRPSPTNWWSCRWSGFLLSSSPAAGYVFSLSNVPAGAMVRVWLYNDVNPTMACEVGMLDSSGVGANGSSPTIQLGSNQNVPIVIEMAWGTNTWPVPATVMPKLSWKIGAAAVAAVPKSSLQRAAATAAYPSSKVTYAQCRIESPREGLSTSPQQQKVGLMLRPDWLVSPLGQGGGAYGMIGWSPLRGFFTQRRQEAASQTATQAGTIFVGRSVAPGTQVTNGVDGIVSKIANNNRTAYLKEYAIGGVVTEAIGYNSSYDTSAAVWTQTPATAVPANISMSVGGGNTWKLLTAFTIGSYVGYQPATPWKQSYQRKYQTQMLQLLNSECDFLTSDDGKTLNFYNNNGSIGDSSPTPSSSATIGLNANGRAWCFCDSGAAFTAAPAGFLRRTYYGNYSYGSKVYGSLTNGPSTTIGSSTTGWATATIQINKVGTVSNASISEINQVLTANGYVQSVTSVSTSVPPSGSLVLPTMVWPLDGLCPAPPTPAAPGVTAATPGVTFSVIRANAQPCIDANPWVPGSALWSPTSTNTLQAFWPRGSNWPGVAGWGVGAYPVTGALRPDVYTYRPTASPAVGIPGIALPVPSSTTTSLASFTPTGPAYNGGGSGSPNYYSMRAGVPNANVENVDDVRPSDYLSAPEVWLRMQLAGNVVTFYGYTGTSVPSGDPPGTGWFQVGETLDISGWVPPGGADAGLLIGPCVQSGDKGIATRASFSDLRIGVSAYATTQDLNGDGRVDSLDWDKSISTSDDYALYLMSQYQAFFGPLEITEDFFMYRDPSTGRPIASEDWFYSSREFWSQSRWWDHGSNVAPATPNSPALSGATSIGGNTYYRIEKDDFTGSPYTFSSLTNRKLLAKVTVLNLNLDAFQTYLKTKTYADATHNVVDGGYAVDPSLASGGTSLKSTFNGLLYAARTNRYPWNPNTNPLLSATQRPDNQNPYLPLSTTTMNDYNAALSPEYSNGGKPASLANQLGYNATSTGWAYFNGIHKLQPYTLAQQPAFKPQEFHHGVRLANAKSIEWAFSGKAASGSNSQGGTDWAYTAPQQQYGTSKMAFVTPNSLYIRGSLNVDRHQVLYNGAATYKYTPFAIFADSVNLLSEAWADPINQAEGMTATATALGGTGALLCATSGPAAKTSYYNAGICTNNQPTTKQRVFEGQAAPFVDTIMFLENWTGNDLATGLAKTMTYEGSLVILDSRRYTRAFLHDAPKSYGTTPFGISTAGGASWVNAFTNNYLQAVYKDSQSPPRSVATSTDQWALSSPNVYVEPTRVYKFNSDFLTNAGTPPFIPFGVSSQGAGGWSRIVQ